MGGQVVGLLALIVGQNKRDLLLAEGALNVVNSLGNDAQALRRLLLLLLKLLNLKLDEAIGVEVVERLMGRARNGQQMSF